MSPGRAWVEALDSRLETATVDGTTPGAACVVLRGGAPLHQSAHGITCIRPAAAARPVTLDTFFDVASLTKVMATTAVAMQLVAEGRLDLEATVAAVLPAFARAGKAEVTVADLLAHRSGLPAWRPWWEKAAADPLSRGLFAAPAERPAGDTRVRAVRRARALTAEAVLAEPLEAAPGDRAVYSDAGFIALALALEAAAGEPLHRRFARTVAAPLGLAARFVDEARPDRPSPVAATREAPSRDGATLLGEVDDDNAYALGGVAGHAGLFARAADVAAFGEALRRTHGGEAGVFDPEVVRHFLRRDAATPGSTRALGFDTPSAEGSTAGQRLSRTGSFGHLGFTGTSLWIDLEAQLVVALLTNRVHVGADPARIRALRAEVADLAADAP